MTSSPEARQRGFTLIEVVVSIAVVALGMMAVFRVVHDTVNNTAYLRDRTLATWIADNQLTEMRLGTELPSVDETEGEVEFANQTWVWLAKVSQTPVDDLRRIDVRVRRQTDPDDSSLVEVSGFVGSVAMNTPQSGTLWTGTSDQPGGADEEGDGDQNGQSPPDGTKGPTRAPAGQDDEE